MFQETRKKKSTENELRLLLSWKFTAHLQCIVRFTFQTSITILSAALQCVQRLVGGLQTQQLHLFSVRTFRLLNIC